jgi:hypothetical protein
MKELDPNELISSAREASPANPTFWDQVVAYFEKDKDDAIQLVKPREVRQERP